MDTVIGVVGKDYVLLLADSNAARSIVVFKNDEDKILALDKFKILATAGPVGDRVNFSEYIQKNIALYELRNELSLTVHAAAEFTRTQLADALRSRGAYQVNCLLGGYDAKHGPSMYYLDYLASMHPMKAAAHGYGSNFVLSTLDRYYKKDMSLDEGLTVLKRCVYELKQRFLIQQPKFKVKCADKDGIREIPFDMTSFLAEMDAAQKRSDAAAASTELAYRDVDMKDSGIRSPPKGR